jgi:hypothetical protein
MNSIAVWSLFLGDLGQRQPGALSHVVLGGKQDRGSCTGDHRGDRQGVGQRGECPR